MAYQSSLSKLDEWDKEVNNKNSSYSPSISNLDKLDSEIAQQQNQRQQTWGQSVGDVLKTIGTSVGQVPIETVKGALDLPSILSAGIIKNPFSSDYRIKGAGENYLAKMGLMDAKFPGYEGGGFIDPMVQGAALAVMGPGRAVMDLGEASLPLVRNALAKVGAPIARPVSKLRQPLKNLYSAYSGKNIENVKNVLEKQKNEDIERRVASIVGNRNISSEEHLSNRKLEEQSRLNDLADNLIEDIYPSNGADGKIAGFDLGKVGIEHRYLGESLQKNRNKYEKQASDLYNSFLKENGKKTLIGNDLSAVPVDDEILNNYLTSKKTPTLVDARGEPLISSSQLNNLKKLKLFKEKLGNPLNFNGNPGLKQSYQEFFKKPTISKAHDFQSKIGHELADLWSVPSGERNKNLIKELTDARTYLQDSIIRKSKEGGETYKEARDIYRENVVPYEESGKAIREASKGKKPSKSLADILANPELNESGHINKILSHLSDSQKKPIIGKLIKGSIDSMGNIDEAKLFSSLNEARSKGFGSFLRAKDFDYLDEASKSRNEIKFLENMAEGEKKFRGQLGESWDERIKQAVAKESKKHKLAQTFGNIGLGAVGLGALQKLKDIL